MDSADCVVDFATAVDGIIVVPDTGEYRFVDWAMVEFTGTMREHLRDVVKRHVTGATRIGFFY